MNKSLIWDSLCRANNFFENSVRVPLLLYKKAYFWQSKKASWRPKLVLRSFKFITSNVKYRDSFIIIKNNSLFNLNEFL